MVNPGQYQEMVAKLDAVLKELEEKLARLESSGAAMLHALDHLDLGIGVVEAHRRAARLALDTMKRAIRLLIDVVRAPIHGIYAPLALARSHHVWKEIKKRANDVSTHVDHPAKRIGEQWTGTAASAYATAVAPQARAAARLGATADKTWQALYDMAYAGLKFFLTLWTTLMIFNAAIAGAVFAYFTGRPEAAYIAAATATVAAIAATTHAFADFANAQNRQAAVLSSDAADILGLAPDGTWPKAVSGTFDNRQDDPADWVARP